MKIYFYISVAASALSLVLAIVLFAIGGVNQGLQAEVQKQQQQLQQEQQELNKTQQIDSRYTQPMLRDMAAASTKDEEMKKLLEHYGYKVVTPTPAPAASPAPAKPAARTESPDLKP
jgi:hypothetical protein